MNDIINNSFFFFDNDQHWLKVPGIYLTVDIMNFGQYLQF